MLTCTDVHWRAHITTPFSLAAQLPGSSALIFPNHCCLSALLEQLWQVPLWRGRWVGSLWALWSERLLCPNRWPLHTANADFHSDSVFVSLFRNALPATYARCCATQYALQVNAHAVHILCRDVFLLLPPLWPDFCIHFLNRWPCGWTHWVPLSVNIYIFLLFTTYLFTSYFWGRAEKAPAAVLSSDALMFVLQDRRLSALSTPVTPVSCCMRYCAAEAGSC